MKFLRSSLNFTSQARVIGSRLCNCNFTIVPLQRGMILAEGDVIISESIAVFLVFLYPSAL